MWIDRQYFKTCLRCDATLGKDEKICPNCRTCQKCLEKVSSDLICSCFRIQDKEPGIQDKKPGIDEEKIEVALSINQYRIKRAFVFIFRLVILALIIFSIRWIYLFLNKITIQEFIGCVIVVGVIAAILWYMVIFWRKIVAVLSCGALIASSMYVLALIGDNETKTVMSFLIDNLLILSVVVASSILVLIFRDDLN
jgi:hypothetical protein